MSGNNFLGQEDMIKPRIAEPEVWNSVEKIKEAKNRCIGCMFRCSEREKRSCDPDGGAGN